MRRSKLLILLAAALAWLGSSNSSVNAQNWALVPGSASDIGVGAIGAAWNIGNVAEAGGFGIYKFNGNGFVKMPGAAVRIAVDPQGNAWVVNSSNDIFKYNGTGWDAVAGQKATDIAIGANGTVWAIGNVAEDGGYGIYRKNSTSWTKIPGSATRIAVDPQGNAWVANSTNGIFKYNGSGWTTMPGTAKDIGIGPDGSVWITGANGSISSWNGSAWDLRSGGADNISVGPGGEPWVVNAQGQVYRGGDTFLINGETTNIASGLSGSGTGSLKFPRQQDWEADMCKALGMTGVASSYAALTPFQQIIGTFGLDATEAYFTASGTPNLTPTEAMMKLNTEVVLVGEAGNVSTSIKSQITGIIGVLVVNHLKKNGSDAQSLALKEWATKIFRQIKADAAVGTLKEYYVWKNNPCTYSASGYTKPQDCYGVVGNNPYASMWQTVSPPSDLLYKAGLSYATGNNDRIVKGVSAALSGIGLLFGFPAAVSGLGITVAAATTAEGTIPVLTALFAAFAPNSTAVAVAVGSAANAAAAGSIGATSWTGVVTGPAAVIIASALIGIVQGVVVIEGAQAEWKLKQAIRAAMSENINMANVVSEQNTEALFMIGLVKSAQNGWTPPSLEIEGEVTFFCEAGYVSKFYLTYTLNGQSKSFSTGDVSAGFWQKFTIPAAAKNIQVRGVMIAAGETNIFTQNLERPTYICYKTYGTVFQTAWNNDWPLSIGGEISDTAGKIKFIHGAGYVANWQITYDLPGKPQQKDNPLGTTLGWNKTYHLPLDATNVRIFIQGATGLAWEPWRTTYDKTFPTVPNMCIKIYGTTLDQKWNSDCN